MLCLLGCVLKCSYALWLMASCELSFYRADLFFQYLFYVSCVEQVVTSWRRCGLMTYLHDSSKTSRSVSCESPMGHALIRACPNSPRFGVRLGVPRLLLHRLWLVMRRETSRSRLSTGTGTIDLRLPVLLARFLPYQVLR